MNTEYPEERRTGALLELVPPGTIVPPGGYFSLSEALAWIGSRDEMLCNAVRWFQRRPERQDAAGHASLHIMLREVLLTAFETDLTNVEISLITAAETGQIDALGMRGFSNFKEIPQEDWIDSRIIFHAEPDTLAPAYSQDGLYPELYWVRVKFLRSMITDHWSSVSDHSPVSSTATSVPTRESGNPGDTNSGLPIPTQITALQEWAKKAAARGVLIRDAGKDARVVLGTSAPTEVEAREALRLAKEQAGSPVSRGRPTGSKSFAKH